MNSRERAQRIRYKLKINSDGERVRLSVFRSLQHISVQAIDDKKGCTIAHASTNLKDFAAKGTATDKAKAVGKEIGEKLLKMQVKDVYFDRGKFAYHGNIKALADAAREAGLNF
jgi:large subunit ribosomal protein L18